MDAQIGIGSALLILATLASVAIVMPLKALAAPTEIIHAQADVFVFEGNSSNTNHLPLLQAGIGRGRDVGRLLTYLRFDMANVQKSSLISKTRVTQATISLFAQSLGLATVDSRFFVSIAPCWDSNWDEAGMSWSNRVCPDPAQPEDIVVIDGADLPQLFRWDVARSLAEAVRRGETRVTFIVSAFRLNKLRGGEREIIPGERFGPEESVGFVRFWSHERAVLGGTVAPTLLITYEQEDTELTRFVKTTVAIISALGVILGIWEGLRRFRGAKNKGSSA